MQENIAYRLRAKEWESGARPAARRDSGPPNSVFGYSASRSDAGGPPPPPCGGLQLAVLVHVAPPTASSGTYSCRLNPIGRRGGCAMGILTDSAAIAS